MAGIGGKSLAQSRVLIDGICYEFDSSTLTATVVPLSDYYSYSGDVSIFSVVYSKSVAYTVTGIGGSAFGGCTGLSYISIGFNISFLSSSVFSSSTPTILVLKPTIVPDGISGAFSSGYSPLITYAPNNNYADIAFLSN